MFEQILDKQKAKEIADVQLPPLGPGRTKGRGWKRRTSSELMFSCSPLKNQYLREAMPGKERLP